MRILHLGKFYPPHPGGVERHMAELIAAQQAAGIEVAALVHATPGRRIDPPRWKDSGALIDAVTCHGQLVFAPISPAWPRRLAMLLSDFQPDLLHLHVPNTSVFWMLGMAAARRLPWVVHWHADIPQRSAARALRMAYPAYRWFEQAMLRHATGIVATSQPYLDASAALAAHRRKVDVIPLGLSTAPQPAAAPEWPSGKLRLLAVGRLSYYKGFDILLEALTRLPTASLVLIGAGEQYASLDATRRRLGLEQRVRLAGNVGDAELEAAYRACDLFCLPSIDRAEAFGMVLLEAMRAGKPVVASDIPGSGVGSVVVHEETGLLVPPSEPTALAAALQRMADDPGLRHRYGETGRERWASHYRIDAVSRRWQALYASVLASSTTG